MDIPDHIYYVGNNNNNLCKYQIFLKKGYASHTMRICLPSQKSEWSEGDVLDLYSEFTF